MEKIKIRLQKKCERSTSHNSISRLTGWHRRDVRVYVNYEYIDKDKSIISTVIYPNQISRTHKIGLQIINILYHVSYISVNIYFYAFKCWTDISLKYKTVLLKLHI